MVTNIPPTWCNELVTDHRAVPLAGVPRAHHHPQLLPSFLQLSQQAGRQHHIHHEGLTALQQHGGVAPGSGGALRREGGGGAAGKAGSHNRRRRCPAAAADALRSSLPPFPSQRRAPHLLGSQPHQRRPQPRTQDLHPGRQHRSQSRRQGAAVNKAPAAHADADAGAGATAGGVAAAAAGAAAAAAAAATAVAGAVAAAGAGAAAAAAATQGPTGGRAGGGGGACLCLVSSFVGCDICREDRGLGAAGE